MQFWDVLRRRKMVRSFDPRPVPAEVIDRVLSSVLHAPSAGFTQGNELLVLDTPAAVADFWRLADDPDDPLPEECRCSPVVVLPLANAASYVARYSEPDKIAAGLDTAAAWVVPYWDVDAGMAALMLLLAAANEGLGAWFFGLDVGEQALLEHFRVADGFRPVGAVALGYAAAADPISAGSSAATRRRRPIQELVHRNGW